MTVLWGGKDIEESIFCLLHDVVELQHGVRRRVDEDVGQRVLMVVHLIWKEDTGETFRPALEPSLHLFH